MAIAFSILHHLQPENLKSKRTKSRSGFLLYTLQKKKKKKGSKKKKTKKVYRAEARPSNLKGKSPTDHSFNHASRVA